MFLNVRNSEKPNVLMILTVLLGINSEKEMFHCRVQFHLYSTVPRMRHSKTRELLVVSFPGDALFFSFCAPNACQRAFRRHVRQLSGTFFQQPADSSQDISDGRLVAARHTQRSGLVRPLTLELSRILELAD
jgi:hypothetical protein